MNRLWVEWEADKFATEHSINGEKRAAFIAGAVFLAKRFARLAEHHPALDPKKDKKTLKYLDNLALADIKTDLDKLLSRAPETTVQDKSDEG